MSRKDRRQEEQESKQLDRIERKLDQDIALDQQILAGQGKKAVSATLKITPNS